MISIVAPLFACFVIWYGGITYTSEDHEPHEWAQPLSQSLKPGDFSTQSSYIWNWGAPLAHDVAWRVSKRDVRKLKPVVGDDLYEFPRSLLLHEANQEPSNVSIVRLVYQFMVFISAMAILRAYVIPLF